MTKKLENADIIIGLEAHLKHNRNIIEYANNHNIKIYKIQSNSIFEIKKMFLKSLLF